MKQYDLNCSKLYSAIDDEELDNLISSILKNFANKGYKRMKGFLIAKRFRCQQTRVRESMRRVDPGVILQALQSRPVLRRR